MYDILTSSLTAPKEVYDVNVSHKEMICSDLIGASSNSCNCTHASDSSPYLKASLTFIENIQRVSPSPVFIFLKTNLNKDQFSSSLETSTASSAVVFGQIKNANHDFVTIENTIDGKKNIAIILYSNILYISFSPLSRFYKKYVEYISKTTPICYEKCNQYLEMLTLLQDSICQNYNSNKSIQVIFSGIRSRNFPVKSFLVVRNLLLIESIFILPIGSISGFDLLPPCVLETENINKEEE